MRPSCLSFIQWMPIEPLTHTPSHMLWCDVRANLFIPLLIISFNLKKHGWLWHYLVSRLPLGYALHLVFSMWGENEGWGNGGYGSAEKEKRYRTRGKSRERWHWPVRDGCKYSERPCQCHSLCTHVDRGKMAVTRCNLMDWFTLEPDGLSFQLVLVSSVWNHEFPSEVVHWYGNIKIVVRHRYCSRSISSLKVFLCLLRCQTQTDAVSGTPKGRLAC